jgi:ABC-type sugar transport system permease subunit
VAAVPGHSSARTAWAFLAFPLAVIAVFTALPTVAGIALSFCEWDGGGPPRFVGLENYRALLRDDPQFWYATRNTVLFALVTVPVTTVGAFLLAVALHARWFRASAVAQTILFLPTVISIVAVGYVWRWVLDPQAGLLEGARSALGLAGEGPMWLGDSPWALAAIVFIQVWRNVGFCVVLYLAALSGIPRSQLEAAGVDGAGSWRTTVHVTWPNVRPMTLFLLITGAIWALQVFDLVWVITGGAEQRWTDVLNAHLYREFAANRLGYSATVGVFVLVLSAIVTVVQLHRAGREASS